MAGLDVWCYALRTVKSVKHYMVLGAYWGAFSLFIAILRALPELPGKLKSSPGFWPDLIASLPWIVGIVAGFLLTGAFIGGLVGWVKLNSEKRRHAS